MEVPLFIRGEGGKRPFLSFFLFCLSLTFLVSLDDDACMYAPLQFHYYNYSMKKTNMMIQTVITSSCRRGLPLVF